jgi:predicted dithiol-disulfide oxidoreductase (DUF899 family)
MLTTREQNVILTEIANLEKDLMEKNKTLAELRRRLPKEEVADANLTDREGATTKLSQLFGNKRDLMVIHNMGVNCPYCTLWADGFNGIAEHLQDRTAFALVSADDYKTQRNFADGRKWRFPMYSAKDSTFIADMGFEGEDSPYGKYSPGVSTFVKDGGKVLRVGKASFGPGDPFCSVWHLFDLLEKGTDDWQPKYKY